MNLSDEDDTLKTKEFFINRVIERRDKEDYKLED